LKHILYMMLQTLMVKLAPDERQHEALRATLRAFNEACNFIAKVAFEAKCANKIQLAKELDGTLYYQVREKFKLSAQMAIRAIAKVVEAYKRDKTVQPMFRMDGAMVYDQRILSWKGLEYVSILTLDGRQKVLVRMGEYQRARMDRIRGQADLILRDGIFYLAVVVDAPEPSKLDPVGTLGVDLGIVNLAVDSDGEIHSGAKVDKVRGLVSKLRSDLQAAGTRSAKRHLKRLGWDEARFQRNVNHCISKNLVAKAKDTKRAIALEDLQGIRERATVRVRRSQRRRQNSWAFGQLRSFVEYKAALAGVPVVLVDPWNTSRTCPKCAFVAKENRVSQAEFKCESCGFAGLADHIAAVNIAARGNVSFPIVSRDCLSHVGQPPMQAPHFRVG